MSVKEKITDASCQPDSCGCHGNPKFDGMDRRYVRILWAVISINATMFVIEMVAGQLAGSQALQAAVIGQSIALRSMAALAKGTSLLVMGLFVFGSTLYNVLFLDLPRAEIMGTIGFLALAANVTSVLLLLRYKDGDANVRSVWLCSRNDAIGNVAVVIAALGVWGTTTAWPDLIVAGVMAALFLTSATQILLQAWQEWRTRTVSGPRTGQVSKE